MIKNNSFLFVLYFSLVPIIYLLGLLFYSVNCSLDMMMYACLFVYIITLIFSIQISGIMSVYSIYLITSAFFIYDCIFISLFSDENFLNIIFPVKTSFTKETGFIFINICILTLYFTNIAYALCRFRKRKQIENKYIEDKELKKISIFILIISIFPCLYKAYIQISFIRANGYLSAFNGDLERLSYPFWTAGCFIIFFAGYFLFLASKPNKREYLIFSILYLFNNFILSLKGARTPFLAALVFVVYWWNNNYGKKVKLKKLIFLGAFVIVFTIGMENVRNGYGDGLGKQEEKRGKELLLSVLLEQTTSRAVPLTIIEKDLKYHEFPFIFSPIADIVLKKIYPSEGQSLVSATKYNDISQVTTMYYSLKMVLFGQGLGGAFLGEMYDFGKEFGVIFLSILIGIIFALTDLHSKKYSNVMVPIYVIFISNFIMLPRSRFLGVNYNYLFLTYSLFFLIHIYRSNKKYILCS